jgi:rRNA-processing protein FCF1
MAPTARSPLDGTNRLIVDGTNLLYRLGTPTSGNATEPGVAAPPAALIGRVRAAIPASITIDLVFDGIGHGVKGRVAQGMFVRYSGRQPADDMILALGGDPADPRGAAAVPGALVVTNDRELRARLLARGIRSVPVVWLTNRLDMPRLASPAPGNRRPPAGSGIGAGTSSSRDGEPADRPGWRPGRRATAKAGPAHKVARHKRHPRHGA